MKGVISSKLKEVMKGQDAKSFILNYLLYPILSGILGFVSFFIVLAAAKYLGSLIGTSGSFQIEGEDFLLSLMGFVFVFLIKFLENFKEETT